MPHERFTDVKACVFDAYGTLFDVHSAVGHHRERLGEHADAVSQVWRLKQLEYTWLRSLMGVHADFWQVTGEALDYALDTYGVDDADLRKALLHAYLELDSYPEVRDVLTHLKQEGLKLAILSNGSPRMLEAAVANADIGELLDGVLSVEEVGIFKPDPRVYELAVGHLNVAPAEISFQSSNAWDAVAAAHYGFRVAWVNRFDQRRERLPARPDAELRTLAELPGILGLS